jgi:hypothetical protein
MKWFSMVFGMVLAVAVIAVLLLIFGVKFENPSSVQGAALYDPNTEITVTGTIDQISDFACPVSEGEIGSHLVLKSGDRTYVVHLLPSRILRSQKLIFQPGEKVQVLGSQPPRFERDAIIAREIVRGDETVVFRDHQGNPMMKQ